MDVKSAAALSAFFSTVILLGSQNALAQASTTTLPAATPAVEASTSTQELTLPEAKTDEVQYNKDFEKIDRLLHNKEFKDDYKLTDLALRARDGSLSKYSMNTSMNLSGPPLGNLSSPDQPNPDGKVGNYAQKFSTTASARYRFDSDHSIGFGTGAVFNHPLQGVDRTDMSTPFMSYIIANRVRDVQMLLSPGINVATTPELQAVGQVANANLNASLVKDLGTSRFSLSLQARGDIAFYNRGYNVGAPSIPGGVNAHQGIVRKNGVSVQANGSDGKSAQYSLGMGPGIKYHLNEKMDLVTSFSIPFYNPRSADDVSVLMPNTPTANIGFGWAYDRDLYIGPGIQMFPTNLSLDTTTVGFSMVFSVL